MYKNGKVMTTPSPRYDPDGLPDDEGLLAAFVPILVLVPPLPFVSEAGGALIVPFVFVDVTVT